MTTTAPVTAPEHGSAPEDTEGVRDAGHVDVLIVGAGVSGIGAAHHLREAFPERTFVMLDAQDDRGGTWWTHRYPGVRSDSDLFTYGYRFKPWRGSTCARPSATGTGSPRRAGPVGDVAAYGRRRPPPVVDTPPDRLAFAHLRRAAQVDADAFRTVWRLMGMVGQPEQAYTDAARVARVRTLVATGAPTSVPQPTRADLEKALRAAA